MQLLNEKHLFGIRPRQQIRFSLDSLSMWESLCDCPDLRGVIKITTLTSALSNAVLKENIKIIQIYYKFGGFISPSGFRSLIFLLNFWTQLEINCNSERFESFSCSLTLTDVPFRLCQCPIIANSSGCFCQRVLEGFSLYQRGKWWKCGKENDHNHVRYFLPFASLVLSLKKGALPLLNIPTTDGHKWKSKSTCKLHLCDKIQRKVQELHLVWGANCCNVK